jgi:hypothetical protein
MKHSPPGGQIRSLAGPVRGAVSAPSVPGHSL